MVIMIVMVRVLAIVIVVVSVIATVMVMVGATFDFWKHLCSKKTSANYRQFLDVCFDDFPPSSGGFDFCQPASCTQLGRLCSSLIIMCWLRPPHV